MILLMAARANVNYNFTKLNRYAFGSDKARFK